MQLNSFKVIILSFFVVLLAGCKSNEVLHTKVTVAISLPDAAVQAGKAGYSVKLTNNATANSQVLTTDTTGTVTVSVEEGVYNVEVTGQKTLTTTVAGTTAQQSYTQTVDIRGLLEKSLVTGGELKLTVPLQIAQKGNGFVIQEVYFSGSTTPAKGSYYQDQYIEVYNNSDSVLYADGLSVVEANHLSNSAVAEYADYPNDLIVDAVYTIPGD